ncbi:MAG: hypothetical protein V7L25_03975 [Nostoc sp.]
MGIDNIGPFQLSPGADAQGRTKISALRFFQEYTLQLTSFIDLGKGWNIKGKNPSPSTLVSTGLGLLCKQGDHFFARLDWGIPLISMDGERRSLQENGLYFSVRYSPF